MYEKLVMNLFNFMPLDRKRRGKINWPFDYFGYWHEYDLEEQTNKLVNELNQIETLNSVTG